MHRIPIDAVADDFDAIQVLVQIIDVLLICNEVFGNIQGGRVPSRPSAWRIAVHDVKVRGPEG